MLRHHGLCLLWRRRLLRLHLRGHLLLLLHLRMHLLLHVLGGHLLLEHLLHLLLLQEVLLLHLLLLEHLLLHELLHLLLLLRGLLLRASLRGGQRGTGRSDPCQRQARWAAERKAAAAAQVLLIPAVPMRPKQLAAAFELPGKRQQRPELLWRC